MNIMKEYSVVDRRKCSSLILDKAIPLAYAPYIGAESVCLYLLYASLADQGNAFIEPDDVREFLGMDSESLEKCNQTLEEYGLIKLENHEHNGRIVSNCYVLQPPPLPQTLYSDLRKKALAKYVEDVLGFMPAESPRKSKRKRRPLITASKLITKLYKGIGNGKVDVFERESGKKHIGDLMQKGYSLEDIDFAIEWSLENARGEIEDFSSIKSLMDRAIAAREEYMTKRTQQAEQEVKLQEEEQIERKMVEAYRKMMPDAEKKRLRERVMEEIRQDKRINEEFVTEQLIIIKENEIIRKEYLRRGIAGDGG
jgi:hypothetical protein